jgi:hypothetical protein
MSIAKRKLAALQTQTRFIPPEPMTGMTGPIHCQLAFMLHRRCHILRRSERPFLKPGPPREHPTQQGSGTVEKGGTSREFGVVAT